MVYTALPAYAYGVQQQQAASTAHLEKSITERDAALNAHYGTYVQQMQAHYASEKDTLVKESQAILAAQVRCCRDSAQLHNCSFGPLMFA